MSRIKDLICVQQGVPTLHDALKEMGLPYDEARTSEAIVARFGPPPVPNKEENNNQ